MNMDERVFHLPVFLQIAGGYACSREGLTDLPMLSHNHGRMVPMAVGTVRSPVAYTLAETDELAEEAVCMGENEIPDARIGGGNACRVRSGGKGGLFAIGRVVRTRDRDAVKGGPGVEAHVGCVPFKKRSHVGRRWRNKTLRAQFSTDVHLPRGGKRIAFSDDAHGLTVFSRQRSRAASSVL